MDNRYIKLAEVIVNHSCKVGQGEKVLIHYVGHEPESLVTEVIRQVYLAGGEPFVKYTNQQIERKILEQASESQIKTWGTIDAYEMSQMNVYIYIMGGNNDSETSDIPTDNLQLYSQYYLKPVHIDIRAPKTKWVALRYPTPAIAQKARMSTEAFENFFFDVCTLDYSKMSRAMSKLVNLMKSTDRVHIIGEGTDITFSIKNMNVIPCAGEMNLPDGEVFTAPVRDSVNGIISYNTPSVFQGETFEQITLSFENGKIIKAASNKTDKLNDILDTDEGARYVGEFAIGVNPFIKVPFKDTLFDEKIMGSFHLTPGNAYSFASNGNHSSIHWDLVCIQTPEYGGGEIYFDDILIRKEGRFVHPELVDLNPENLV